MNISKRKGALFVIIGVLVLTAFAGCGTETTVSAGINIREMLCSLAVSEQTLGIAGKYYRLSDVTNGSVDPDLIGTWSTIDGETTYTYTAEGAATVASPAYSGSEVQVTCLTVKDYQIICEEISLSPEFGGTDGGETQLSFFSYCIRNDALYQVPIEEVGDAYASTQSSIIVMYRVDENGSAAGSAAKNPISMASFDGKWTSDKGSVRIKNGVMQCGKDKYSISLNEKAQLIAEKDGLSTTYKTSLCIVKDYSAEDRSQITESIMLNLSYTGTDENDKPNLLPVLDDWHTEHNWDNWYYTVSFALQ